MNTPLDAGDGRRTDVVIDVTATPDREFGEVVLSAIAGELDADPTTLPPIADSVDPDILNEFLDGDGASAKAIAFEYLGYDVVVTSDGLVQLRSLA
jgi:hypothetical protein